MEDEKWITEDTTRRLLDFRKGRMRGYNFPLAIGKKFFIFVYFIAVFGVIQLALNAYDIISGDTDFFSYFFTGFFFISSCLYIPMIFCTHVYNKTNKVAEMYGISNLQSRLISVSLKKMGIKKPLEFMEQNPKHVEAYKAISDGNWGYSFWDGGASDIEDIDHNKHMTCMLVFPTEDALSRENLILSINRERGITDFNTIRALLNEAPSGPLANGAL